MGFKRNGNMNRLALSKDQDELHEACDSSCNLLSDASRLAVFEDGFELAHNAEGQDVWVVKNKDTAWFFVGTLEEVIAKIKDLPASDKDDDDNMDEGDDDTSEEE